MACVVREFLLWIFLDASITKSQWRSLIFWEDINDNDQLRQKDNVKLSVI